MVAVLIALTIGLPWAGALSVWWAGDQRPRLQHALAISFSVAAGVVALALLPFTTNAVVLRLAVGGIFGDFTFVPDGLGVFLAVIATVIGSLAVIFSVDYMRGEAQLGRYYALVLFFIGAMAGLVLTGSLLLAFVFWEITAFCSYALISFHNDDPKAVAGGIKALIMTQLGGIGLLAGALLAYASLGSYEISLFLERASTLPPTVLSVAAFGFLVAAAAKSAQVPFHTWLPDAMEAPTPVSALIHAATMVNAGVYLLARFYPAFASVPGWTIAVILVGVLSAILAAVMGLVSTDIKRILAYSTISQLGYMVYAVGVGSVFASQFHLLSHAVFKALLFLGAGAVIHTIGTRDLRKMGGLGQKMPFVRNTFAIGALALAGLPIFNGFWSKELVLEAGLNQGPAWAYALMLIGAGITACYTFRLVWLAFFGEPRGHWHAHDAPAAMRVSLGLLTLGTLTTWLLAGPFGRLLAESLPFHHLHAEGTMMVIVEIVTAPATLIALFSVMIGLAAWWWRDRLRGLEAWGRGIARAAAADFGFEQVNRHVVSWTQTAATALRATQTGQLNWNMVGIVGGLVIVLAIVMWGA
ncbi:MAG: NADH-quinone oxidoreductase subunit L [Anaerolineae bacterium]|nr:NADH-quinone oxidoreductase subunit L [Anaerolineae bacterium]MDW8099886.1 NADH-quinone oxidoreductase subunit L [Anaerolineae bacterium]